MTYKAYTLMQSMHMLKIYLNGEIVHEVRTLKEAYAWIDAQG
jgi:hypothetical protein